MTRETTTADPVLPEVKMNLVPVKAPVTGRVVANDPCLKGKSNSFVRHTEIDVSGTPLAGNFLVGQSFGVIAPGVDEREDPLLPLDRPRQHVPGRSGDGGDDRPTSSGQSIKDR